MDLKKFFDDNRKVAIAFSGGVDSVYLMFMAKHYGADIKAYFIDSAFQTDEDRKDAKRAADECGCELEFIYIDVLSDEKISLNSPKRCYYCKKKLLAAVTEKACNDGYNVVIDGNNASDSFDDRPGMRAVTELGVLSPLRMCALTKADIRAKSKEMGIFTWDKPSNSCLATRIEDGSVITEAKVASVDFAESKLRDFGFSDFRVRCYGDYFLIQVRQSQFELAINHRDEIISKLEISGIKKIYLDLKER